MIAGIPPVPIGPALSAPIVLATILTAAICLRTGRATDRACAMILALTLALHVIGWAFYGASQPIHLLCDLTGFSFLLPIALRSRFFYPAATCSAWLVLLLFQAIAIDAAPGRMTAALVLAGMARLLTLATMWIGLLRGGRDRAAPTA